MSKKHININSCEKGKVSERAAVHLLHRWGYPDARRNQQYSGAAGDADVILPESAPDLFIEIKTDNSLSLGNAAFDTACVRAAKDAGWKKWVMLWRTSRSPWHTTARPLVFGRVTVTNNAPVLFMMMVQESKDHAASIQAVARTAVSEADENLPEEEDLP
jgi:Holliday junction resolvase-like predicted endonuclease